MLELGKSYFEHLGIDRKDKETRQKNLLQNFEFFGAPTVLLFFMDKSMGYWPTLDLGILVGTMMIEIQNEGLGSIAQAALAGYPDVIRKELNINPNWNVALGMSLGYIDESAHINSFRSTRASNSENIIFFE